MNTTLYMAGNSFVHRMDPRTKMSLLFFAVVITFFLYNPLTPLLVILGLSAMLLISVGPNFFKNPLVRLVPIIIVTVTVLHGFVNPVGKTPILIGDAVIRLPYFETMNWEGVYVGFVFSFRITAVFLASLTLVLTTRPEDLVSALVKIKIPFQYASMFGMSLQMIPIMQEEARLIIQAQRARALQENNLVEKVRALVPLFVPLAVGSMQRAETTAMVLEARAFGAPVTPTEMRVVRMKRLDYVVLFTCSAIAIAVVATRIIHGDVNWMDSAYSFWGLFYPISGL